MRTDIKLDRDTLFIIAAPFEDAEYPGQTFFCRDCATMEAALALNPAWSRQVDVQRLGYPRPRHAVIELLGEENQGLPALIFADTASAPEGAKRASNGLAFLTEARAILRYLGERYGGIRQHP